MRHGLQIGRALALQTAVEILRQPLPALLTTLASSLAALFPLLLAFQFGEDGRLVRDGILALHFTLGVYLAAVASSATFGREWESGTGALVLSKAVSRNLFYLSKFAGLVLVLAVFTFCMGAAAVLSTRVGLSHYRFDSRAGGLIGLVILAAFLLAGLMNYRKGRPFPSTLLGFLAAGLLAAVLILAILPAPSDVPPIGSTAGWLLPPLLLVFFALVIMAALTLLLAARLPAIPVLALAGLVFLLGLVNGPLFGAAAARGSLAAGAASVLFPDWQQYWMADALAGGGRIPFSYVGWVGLEAACYTAALLLAGLAVFRNREVTP